MHNYSSTLLHHGEIIDCRNLTVSLEFYQMSGEQLIALALDSLSWIESILDDDFVAKWAINGRTTRWSGLTKELSSFLNNDKNYLSYSCLGFAKSPLTFDSKTLNKSLSFIQRDYACLLTADPGLSVDYRAYWNDLFPNGRDDNDSIILKLNQLFRERNRIHNSVYILPDFQALFSSMHYNNQSQRYYGDFSFYISAFCLGNAVSHLADSLVSKLTIISNKYININARVMLQPFLPNCIGNSPHMRYFGEPYGRDGSHHDAGLKPNEWYPFYYLLGVEWANIISPLTQTHLNEGSNHPENCAVEKLKGGCILVKSTKAIDDFDVNDLLVLKKYVYRALYPGESSISLRRLFDRDVNNFFMSAFPRSDWANIPVLDNEISIIGTDLVFSINRT